MTLCPLYLLFVSLFPSGLGFVYDLDRAMSNVDEFFPVLYFFFFFFFFVSLNASRMFQEKSEMKTFVCILSCRFVLVIFAKGNFIGRSNENS